MPFDRATAAKINIFLDSPQPTTPANRISLLYPALASWMVFAAYEVASMCKDSSGYLFAEYRALAPLYWSAVVIQATNLRVIIRDKDRVFQLGTVFNYRNMMTIAFLLISCHMARSVARCVYVVVHDALSGAATA